MFFAIPPRPPVKRGPCAPFLLARVAEDEEAVRRLKWSTGPFHWPSANCSSLDKIAVSGPVAYAPGVRRSKRSTGPFCLLRKPLLTGASKASDPSVSEDGKHAKACFPQSHPMIIPSCTSRALFID